jgi:hypothetical protein
MLRSHLVVVSEPIQAAPAAALPAPALPDGPVTAQQLVDALCGPNPLDVKAFCDALQRCSDTSAHVLWMDQLEGRKGLYLGMSFNGHFECQEGLGGRPVPLLFFGALAPGLIWNLFVICSLTLSLGVCRQL